MADRATHTERGRLLLFEPDALKRHYYTKYVLGILWRGLSDVERQQRLRDVIRHVSAECHPRGQQAPPTDQHNPEAE